MSRCDLPGFGASIQFELRYWPSLLRDVMLSHDSGACNASGAAYHVLSPALTIFGQEKAAHSDVKAEPKSTRMANYCKGVGEETTRACSVLRLEEMAAEGELLCLATYVNYHLLQNNYSFDALQAYCFWN